MKRHSALNMIAAIALMSATPGIRAMEIRRREDDDDNFREIGVDTVNTGRRKEKNAAALAKAEAKRQRKAAKRVEKLTHNVELTGRGPDAKQ